VITVGHAAVHPTVQKHVVMKRPIFIYDKFKLFGNDLKVKVPFTKKMNAD
jgi:hypothetical protein